MCVHHGLAASREQLQRVLHHDCDQQLREQSLRYVAHLQVRHHQQPQVRVLTMCHVHYRHLGARHVQYLRRRHRVLLSR